METEKKAFETKDMTGTLWMDVQEKEGKDGKYYVRTGSCRINGIDMWMNAYEKETKTGKKLLSITFKSKNIQSDAKPSDEAPF